MEPIGFSYIRTFGQTARTRILTSEHGKTRNQTHVLTHTPDDEYGCVSRQLVNVSRGHSFGVRYGGGESR